MKVKLGGAETEMENYEETGFCKVRLEGKMRMLIVEENENKKVENAVKDPVNQR